MKIALVLTALLHVGLGLGLVKRDPILECKMEMIFVMDSSGSIGGSNWVKVKEFAKNLAAAWPVSADDMHVGVIEYSEGVDIKFNLKDYSTVAEVQAAIDAMPLYGHTTNTASALKTLYTSMYTPEAGARPDVLPVAIVITDGQSNDPARTAQEATTAKENGILLFSTGIGAADVTELNAISSDPDDQFVFYVDSFDDLQKIVSALTDKACKAATPCVSDCSDKPDGDYQSCETCNGFVTCSNGLVNKMPCPGGLVWDDSKKDCEYTSETCFESVLASRKKLAARN